MTWVVNSTTAAEAQRQVEHYRRAGFPADVIPARVGRRTVYRVTVGRYRTEAEAAQARASLPDDVPADAWIYSFGP